MSTPIDFSEDVPVVSAEALSAVSLKAQELIDLQDDLRGAELQVDRLKERLHQVASVELPEAMDAARMKDFTLTNGQQIVVKPIVAGTIPKTRQAECYTWLKDHDHDGIIKRQVVASATFPKGKGGKADELVEYLKSLELLSSLGVSLKDEPSVHPQTFGAWAREMYAKHNEEHVPSALTDEDCPFCNETSAKLLGLYVGRKAEVLNKNK